MSQNAMPGSGPPPGPPYPPKTVALGLTPTPSLDVPITAVFMALFIGGAVGNMIIIQTNRRRGHKFFMQNLLFGFCMARTTTCVMRIVWAYRLTNVSVAIAAQIFVQAGVLVVFIVNLIFMQRIIRATYPHIGWHKSISIGFSLFYASVVLMLVALITCVVQSFYTLDTNIMRIDLDVEHVGQAYFLAAAFIPIPVLIIGYFLPKPASKDGESRVEKFGSGRFRTKVLLLLTTSVLLTIGAAFRVTTSYFPRPQTDPGWYQSKACFYSFNFGIEITVIALYLSARVDRRFHVPDGAAGPGDYTGRWKIRSEVDIFDTSLGRTGDRARVANMETADEWANRATLEMEDAFQRIEKHSKRWSFYN